MPLRRLGCSGRLRLIDNQLKCCYEIPGRVQAPLDDTVALVGLIAGHIIHLIEDQQQPIYIPKRVLDIRLAAGIGHHNCAGIYRKNYLNGWIDTIGVEFMDF